MLFSFLKSLFASVLFLIISACGSESTVHVKEYTFFVESEDQEIIDAVRVLFARYNKDFGDDVLKIVDQKSEANSSIKFISGLRSSEKKLGLGQWITTTSAKNGSVFEGGSFTKKIEVVYSMELSFDLENFKAKLPYLNKEGHPFDEHLYTLLCHEVGHGLQIPHKNNLSSVMYPSIPDVRGEDRPPLDLSSYFAEARAFFQ